MKAQEAQALLNNLLSDAQRACEIARVAARNKKALPGANPYGGRFHDVSVSIATAEGKLRPFIDGLGLQPADRETIEHSLSTLKCSESLTGKQRSDALRALQLLCHSVILPKVRSSQASPVPHNENVLPMSVVKGTRGYIERVVLQANGTYEHQWFDACSVMIRRLVETLIIEVYEAKNKPQEIKGTDGNYLMLSHLVDRMLADATFQLGRETKKGLPLIKALGDRSAHNRYFLAKKEDIDKVAHDLRVIVEEFLNLSGIRK